MEGGGRDQRCTSTLSTNHSLASRVMFVTSQLQTLQTLLESFYEQLSLSTSQQYGGRGDASKSMLSMSINASLFAQQSTRLKDKRLEAEGEVRRHVERLLLRLDFNGEFSKRKVAAKGENILQEGGLA